MGLHLLFGEIMLMISISDKQTIAINGQQVIV